jgi:hypothetical protein
MGRKDDLKLLFNFMIELLKDEQETNNVKEETIKYEVPNITPKEFNEINKQVLTEKQDDSAKHILEVMKRAELMDKMRSTVISREYIQVVPPSLRDDDEIAQNDREIVNTHKVEKKDRNMNDIRAILSNAKNFMDELEFKRPLIPSVSPSVLNEQQKIKEGYLQKRNVSDNTNVTEIKSKK